MNKTLVKVCGITELAQAEQLRNLGVDYAGFIFYAPSPRYMVGKIEPAALRRLKGIQKVGVFVNAAANEIEEAVEAYGLDAVQLHGEETPAQAGSLNARIQVIKAFRISGDEEVKTLTGPYAAAVTAFLFDTKAKAYGGTGQQFDWSVLKTAQFSRPFFLSGGIGPDDVAAVKAFLTENKVYALDVNSKFETAQGIKDLALIQQFLNGLKGL
ncbi:phosphoribosylanthranilate isomerase [Niabella ginsenosidivorans]|uniref:N-(5'-phosphoribosyl)anthranilate isomerase n=1 Tax=Niabella ginsenosidivorans TaxID=1176587 RepID=A0A1A9HZE8_9BACT|nr:phosphoribosylanthranilate isomerase [Niabella ginsenosidivorans]ANH79841.1 phosphoribosylanthranilate isomerase [Niabella ginsenosidivorans]